MLKLISILFSSYSQNYVRGSLKIKLWSNRLIGILFIESISFNIHNHALPTKVQFEKQLIIGIN